MSKKLKALVAIGGTGGHVFPGCNLAKHLIDENFKVDLVSDKRGYRYLNKYKNFNIFVLPSSPLIKKNIITLFFSFFFILYSLMRSLIFLTFHRPSIIFGMGGYASFPICVAAIILKIKFIVYENNLVVGKANKYLIPFAYKILVSFEELEGIPKKYEYKVFKTGNIINKEIINFSKKIDINQKNKQISCLVLGGSQAAKVFAEKLPKIFKDCSDNGIQIKIYQHCLPYQNEKLSSYYTKAKIEFETFNFSNNLIEYFSKVNLAITRSGSSILAELTNSNIPFISIPLPSSADNHQLKNAEYYKRKKIAFLLEEKDIDEKLYPLIKEIYDNSSLIDKISLNQRQYSDKNVYNNINQILEKIINEKN